MDTVTTVTKAQKRRQWFKDLFFISLGILMYSFGYTAFILPEKVVMGGVAGISALLYYAFNFNTGISIYVLNFLMLAIAFRALSRQFTISDLITMPVCQKMGPADFSGACFVLKNANA